MTNGQSLTVLSVWVESGISRCRCKTKSALILSVLVGLVSLARVKHKPEQVVPVSPVGLVRSMHQLVQEVQVETTFPIVSLHQSCRLGQKHALVGACVGRDNLPYCQSPSVMSAWLEACISWCMCRQSQPALLLVSISPLGLVRSMHQLVEVQVESTCPIVSLHQSSRLGQDHA